MGNTILAYLFLSLYIILPAAAIYFVKYNFNKPGLNTYSSYIKCNLNKKSVNNNEDKKNIDTIINTIQERAGARGTIISILLSASAIIQAILKGMGASEPRLLLLYGFIMAAIIGYMGDQSYGTDEGYSLFKLGTQKDNIITGKKDFVPRFIHDKETSPEIIIQNFLSQILKYYFVIDPEKDVIKD